MKNLYKWFFATTLLLVFFGCKKSSTEPPIPAKDTTLPTISLIDPTAGKTYVLGSALHLQMDLSDNVELKSYKLDIAKSLKGLVTSEWAYGSGTIAIAAGKKTLAVNQSEIIVPLTVTGNQTATGNYDFTVTCYDTSDNHVSTTLTIALTK